MEGKIVVTKIDYERLKRVIKLATGDKKIDPKNLLFLSNEIERAEKIDSKTIAPNFVTMHSQIEVKDLDTGKLMMLSLVYPEKADFKKGLISVLSPLGCALLGYKAGDTISFEVPAGKKQMKIEKVIYQPEAAGDEGL
jgi:regulator of nucleoside diphosphate kinase